MFDTIVIGSGPAGYSASIYLSRANINHIILGSTLGVGGNLVNTTDIENFPGFPGGINGSELMTRMQEQALSFNPEILKYEDVISASFSNNIYKLQTNDGNVYESKTIIIATGGSYKQLGIEGEKEYLAKGVSYCATCDGFFFKNKNVAVVGGGDSAFEEAIYLSSIVKRVYLCHRREEFRASQIMIDRAKNIENIEFVTPVIVDKIEGDENEVKKIVFNNNSQIDVSAVFIAIGHTPNSNVFKDLVELDEGGYIIKAKNKGTFFAGDVSDSKYKQAIVAAGSGAKAGIDVINYYGN